MLQHDKLVAIFSTLLWAGRCRKWKSPPCCRHHVVEPPVELAAYPPVIERGNWVIFHCHVWLPEGNQHPNLWTPFGTIFLRWLLDQKRREEHVAEISVRLPRHHHWNLSIPGWIQPRNVVDLGHFCSFSNENSWILGQMGLIWMIFSST